MKMKNPDNPSMIRLFGKDIPVPKDYSAVYNPTLLNSLPPSIFGQESDRYAVYNPTPLNSLPPSTFGQESDRYAVYNPTPLNSLPPSTFIQESDGFKKHKSYLKLKPLVLKKKKKIRLFGVDIDAWETVEYLPVHKSDEQKISVSRRSNDEEKETSGESSKKRKKKNLQDDDIQEPKILLSPRIDAHKSSKKRKKNHDDDIQEPKIPLSPRIIQEIGGAQPVFLYRKKLQSSDTRSDQSRLLITRSQKLEEFLIQNQKLDQVRGKSKLKIVSVNQEGQYQELRLGWWSSVQKFVLNEGWNKLVSALGLKEDCFVELWGYQHNSDFRLAVTFEKPATEEEVQKNISSGITN